MLRNSLAPAALIALAAAGCTNTSAQSTQRSPAARPTITVQSDHPGASVSPAMWGAFFEDINFGGDGGLYAELVKNRAFEFPDPLMGWIKVSPSLAKGDIEVRTDDPYRPSQTHYVRITSQGTAPIGISNEGYRGMGLKAGDAYDFSAQIRNVDGNSKVTVQLVGNDGTTLASAQLTGLSNTWQKITATLHPNATDANARLVLFLNGPGTVDFDFVSLFPEDTWKHRPGGLRKDMVQALADLHPGFLRFPGGCIVEGKDLAHRYQWKNTIGPIDDRKTLVDRWNYEFSWRPTPDYYQSFGLGFFEYFQLCEDIHAQPLPIINCGMACQFNSGELCPPDDLAPYIQDALDLIEFANGPATSTWGAKRAAMGHPEPFNPPLRMMGIGNEQWGPQYLERLAAFTKAIKDKHPEITLVSDSGPSPDDDRFDYLWPKLQQFNAGGHGVDIVDQHCYANPIWFLSNANRFDNYDPKGPKVFFGEYAAQSDAICSTKNQNNLDCALAEAAYMTGMERDAAVVRMASYAPLFSNTEAWQWRPDLIWVDSLHTVPSVNYYVQQLFCENRGDVVLPTSNNSHVLDFLPTGGIALATSNATAEFKDLHVTNNGRTLFAPAFSSNKDFTAGPTWNAADATYRQSDPTISTTASAGDASWGSDYTLSLKLRRTSDTGAITLTVADDETHAIGARTQWTLGAPIGGPTVADPTKPEFILLSHFAEQDQLLAHQPGTLDTNRWYDAQITVHGDRIDCYLDGKLIQSAQMPHHRIPALFSSATRDNATGDIILKVVNPADHPLTSDIHLAGSPHLVAAKIITLTGNPNAEDSMSAPAAILPTTASTRLTLPNFSYTFKPCSLTILRLGTAP